MSSSCSAMHGFEDGTFQGWTVTGSGPATWHVVSSASSAGNNSVWLGSMGSADSLHPSLGADSYSGPDSSRELTSPLVHAMDTDVVSFDIRLAIEQTPARDTFDLFVMQGASRFRLWRKGDGGFPVLPHPENAARNMSTTSGAFFSISVPVGTPGAGIDLANPVQFVFEFSGDDALNRTEGIFLDQIEIPCAV